MPSTANSRTRAVVSLCRESRRILAIRACCRASLIRAFFRFADPGCLRDTSRPKRCNFARFCRSALGPSILLPSCRVASVVTPRSTPPTAWFSRAGTCQSTSTTMLAYQRSAVRETVTDIGRPANRKVSRIRTQPTFRSWMRLPSTQNVPGPLSARKASCTPFRLKFGYRACLRKKRWKAFPNARIACCGAVLLTSSIHGHSIRFFAFN